MPPAADLPDSLVLLPFALVFVPVGIVMVVWSVVTVCRIMFPERPLPLFQDRVAERRRRTEAGISVPVGFRDIHDDMPEHVRRVSCPYEHYRSEGWLQAKGHVPEPWMDDVWQRRN